MISTLWNSTVFGGVSIITEDSVITTPRMGDGNWRGGWWAKYDRQTGECKWRWKHRRGAEIFDRIGDIIVATTHKYSGVYAISLASGKCLWSRLGDRFDWMLKCFDVLPIDNGGDAPEMVWKGGILTRSGRLLDVTTGSIISRHQLEYLNCNGRVLARVDGVSVSPPSTLRKREAIDLYKQESVPVETLLAQKGLGLAGIHPCVICAHDLIVCLTCKLSEKYLPNPQSRLAVGGSRDEIPHSLVVFDRSSLTVLGELDLGIFYTGQIDWADESILAVTTETLKQRFWSCQRHLWLFEWCELKKLLSK
jgi:hypothetical protein